MQINSKYQTSQTVTLVKSIEIQMAIAFQAMVDSIPICELAKQRPRVLCKWMKGQSVDTNRHRLLCVLATQQLLEKSARPTTTQASISAAPARVLRHATTQFVRDAITQVSIELNILQT